MKLMLITYDIGDTGDTGYYDFVLKASYGTRGENPILNGAVSIVTGKYGLDHGSIPLDSCVTILCLAPPET